MSDDPDLWLRWQRIVPDSPQSRAEWTALIERWSEPHRGYHGLEHLVFVLAFLDEWFPLADRATLLAAWFHDAVYDPRSATNEADSAELAGTVLPTVGLADEVPEVRRLILATTDHSAAPDAATAALLDADLAILGQPPAAYLRYVEGVRREYQHLSDDEFLAGRSAILRGFAERDRIYRDDRVHAALDDAAQRNLAAELAIYDGRASASDGDDAGPSRSGA